MRYKLYGSKLKKRGISSCRGMVIHALIPLSGLSVLLVAQSGYSFELFATRKKKPLSQKISLNSNRISARWAFLGTLLR